MECTCVRQTDLPSTSTLYADLLYRFDRVQDLFPGPPNNAAALHEAARFSFPVDRRAALVRALTPLNEGNPALSLLAEEKTVAVVTGQQVGLFSGPAYTVYKALTAIRIARELTRDGTPAVPVFWLATEDHDFDEVNHVWVFGPDYKPVRLQGAKPEQEGPYPVGEIAARDLPLAALREALAGFPFAADAEGLVERAYAGGSQTMGSGFAAMIRELFAPYGLLLINPMTQALRDIAAPLMRRAVEQMPELTDALVERSKALVNRGYHAQVLVDKTTSLVFLLEGGQRIALRRSGGDFSAGRRKITPGELADRASSLSPNALLRPVMQDYMLPTVAYVGGPAELAYLAQSQVLYKHLLGRQPVAFPRAGFTLLDERSRKRMVRYRLSPTDLFRHHGELREMVGHQLVPNSLRAGVDHANRTASHAFDTMAADLLKFDPSLAKALATSRRKIDYQVNKIVRKTANQMLRRDAQAEDDTCMLHGLAFPERHLQERLYSIVPFIAKFGPGLIDEIYSAVRLECPDHQILTV